VFILTPFLSPLSFFCVYRYISRYPISSKLASFFSFVFSRLFPSRSRPDSYVENVLFPYIAVSLNSETDPLPSLNFRRGTPPGTVKEYV